VITLYFIQRHKMGPSIFRRDISEKPSFLPKLFNRPNLKELSKVLKVHCIPLPALFHFLRLSLLVLILKFVKKMNLRFLFGADIGSF